MVEATLALRGSEATAEAICSDGEPVADPLEQGLLLGISAPATHVPDPGPVAQYLPVLDHSTDPAAVELTLRPIGRAGVVGLISIEMAEELSEFL